MDVQRWWMPGTSCVCASGVPCSRVCTCEGWNKHAASKGSRGVEVQFVFVLSYISAGVQFMAGIM